MQFKLQLIVKNDGGGMVVVTFLSVQQYTFYNICLYLLLHSPVNHWLNPAPPPPTYFPGICENNDEIAEHMFLCLSPEFFVVR